MFNDSIFIETHFEDKKFWKVNFKQSLKIINSDLSEICIKIFWSEQWPFGSFLKNIFLK